MYILKWFFALATVVVAVGLGGSVGDASAQRISDTNCYQFSTSTPTADGELITIEIICFDEGPHGSYPEPPDPPGPDEDPRDPGPGGGGGGDPDVPPDVVDPDPGTPDDPGGQDADPGTTNDNPPPTEEEYGQCIQTAINWQLECGEYVCSWSDDTPWSAAGKDLCDNIWGKGCGLELDRNLEYCDKVNTCVLNGGDEYWCRMKYFFWKLGWLTGGSVGDPWPDRIDRIERKLDPDGTNQ